MAAALGDAEPGTGLNPWSICTSHVERNNLAIRTFMRRFTQLSLVFSKKLQNLAAMAAGIIKELWTIEDLYNAVIGRWVHRELAYKG